ncbi:hypothetical protein T484DRAFT_1914878, partial [Baffinella frigidus]
MGAAGGNGAVRLREAVSVRRHGGGQDMGAAALAELKQTVVGELARCMTAAAAGAAERRSARSPHGSQHGSQHGGGRAGDVAESGGDAEEDAGGGGRVRLLGAGREWRELGAGRDWREGGRAGLGEREVVSAAAGARHLVIGCADGSVVTGGSNEAGQRGVGFTWGD